MIVSRLLLARTRQLFIREQGAALKHWEGIAYQSNKVRNGVPSASKRVDRSSHARVRQSNGAITVNLTAQRRFPLPLYNGLDRVA